MSRGLLGENIVSIETLWEEPRFRMVGRVWPRLCWGKPRADVPWASRARTASTRLLSPCFVSQPCLNGGTYTRLVNTYECTCQVGFTGNQWDLGPHFPILSRYFHLVSFTIIWFFRVPPYSTCLSLWEGTGMFQSTIPNFLLKGEKEKAKGSNTPQWLT